MERFLLKYFLVVFLIAAVFTNIEAQSVGIDSTTTRIQSPDKNISVQFYQKKTGDSTRAMYYTVSYKNKLVILESLLDIQLDNHLSEQAMALKVDRHKNWCENLKIIGSTFTTRDTVWKPLFGERSLIRDNYNKVAIHLVKDDNPIYKMDVDIRVYNEGVAIRYYFKENEKGTYYRVMSENTTFTLPDNTKAWITAWAQGSYRL